MCMTDYDPPTLYQSSMRKAKKQHKCGECYRTIEPGEQYQYVLGVWNGARGDHKTCQHCVVAQILLFDKCHGFIHQGVKEDLHEHLYEPIEWKYTAARLIVGMRRKWKAFRGDGLMPVVAL